MSYQDNFMVQELSEKILASQKAFLRKVYGWMTLGLLITTISSLYFFTSGAYALVLNTIGVLVLFILQIGLVVVLSSWINKMSAAVATALFIFYSALTGVTLSSIFLIYNIGTIVNTFFIASITFGALSIFGFATKKDLTAWGSFFFMGLIGILVAMFINFFLSSNALDFVISVIGVIVFAGLTAYDTQKLKEMHLIQIEGKEIASKSSILGALVLYLDFINLFLMLLRLFGGGRK
jgi:FtsH-binding integral membrane protein